MLRTIQKVQRVFDYLVDPEEPGEVKFENLERLMKLLYGETPGIAMISHHSAAIAITSQHLNDIDDNEDAHT